jgi:Ca2+-binding RTX toxin-like protein
VATVNLTVAAATKNDSSFVLVAGDADVVATGSKALYLKSTSTADSFDASAMTGAVTATTSSSFDTVTTGSGADTITTGATASNVNTGAGNDTIHSGGADLDLGSTAVINGGTGTDTLYFDNSSSGSDWSSATISNIEYIAIDTSDTISLAGSYLNGSSIVFTDDGVLNIKKIGTTLDLSNHSFSDANATVTIDYATNKLTTLGASSPTSITGSSVADTITTDAGADTIYGGAGADVIVAGAGADYIDAGNGADTVTGGTGADTIILTETTANAAADQVKITVASGATDSTESSTTAYDSITGFSKALDTLKFTDSDTVLTFAAGANDTSGATTDGTVDVLVTSGVVTSITLGDGTDANALVIGTDTQVNTIAKIVALLNTEYSTGGNTVTFQFGSDSYVWQQNGDADSLVKLVGVTGLASESFTAGVLTLA